MERHPTPDRTVLKSMNLGASQPVKVTPAELGSALPALIEQTRVYISEAQAANTRKAYHSDRRRFKNWCHSQSPLTLPTAQATGASYLAADADLYPDNAAALQGL